MYHPTSIVHLVLPQYEEYAVPDTMPLPLRWHDVIWLIASYRPQKDRGPLANGISEPFEERDVGGKIEKYLLLYRLLVP